MFPEKRLRETRLQTVGSPVLSPALGLQDGSPGAAQRVVDWGSDDMIPGLVTVLLIRPVAASVTS